MGRVRDLTRSHVMIFRIKEDKPGSFVVEAKLIGVCKQKHKQPCLPSELYRNSSPTSGLQEGQNFPQKSLS